MIIKTKKNNNHKGFVMLFSIILASTILAMTFGVANIALKEMNFSTSARESSTASLAADIGIECALYNDTTASNKFPIPYVAPTTPINSCAGIAAPITGSGGVNSATYSFTLYNLVSTGKGCVKVTILKDSSKGPIETTITSTGYNIGNSSCASSSTNRVEREYIAAIGYTPSAPPPPPPPPPPTTYDLTINKPGAGSGTVNGVSNPAQTNIDCGATCSANYSDGTIVALSTTPDPGSNFSGWSGDADCSDGSVTMSAARSCTATFGLLPAITLDPTVSDSLVRTGSTVPNNASPITWSHTVSPGSNKILVVTVSSRGGGSAPTGITFGASALTKIREDTSGVTHTSIWYLVGPTPGTNSIRATYSTIPNVFQGNGLSLSGVNQIAPVDAQNGAGALSSGPATVNLVTNTPNTWIIDVAGLRTANSETLTMNPMSFRTERENSLSGVNGLRSAVSTVGPAASAGSYAMSWTTSYLPTCTSGNCTWTVSAAAFKQ